MEAVANNTEAGSMSLPPPNSRVAFCGPTRSGKTYLARKILKNYNNVAVMDPKGEFDWKEGGKRFARDARNWSDFEKELSRSERDGFPVIFRPPPEHLNDIDRLDRFYEIAFHRRHTLTYTDELYFVSNGQDLKNTPWLYRCYIAGASRGVGTWAAFQRPARIPLVALTETELRCIFYLRADGDRKRIVENFGEIPWEKLRRTDYGFVMSTDDWSSSVTRVK